MLLLWQIFYTFFFIGTFSFGGGYAMIPLIQKEVITKFHWLTLHEFTDIIAISQSTPGPLAVNTATYVGFKVAGIAGSAVATIALVLPAFFIILILANLVIKHRDHFLINNSIAGLRPIVVALILGAGISLAQVNITSFWQGLAAAIAFVLAYFFRIHPIAIIIVYGLVGVFFF